MKRDADADLVEPVRIVAEKCLFRAQTKVVDLAVGRAGRELTRRHAALFVCDGIGRDARADKGNEVIGGALHVRIPIVGIAPDPKRQLPRDLMRSAEHRIALPGLDQAGLALVVEAVVGGLPSRMFDPDLLRMIDISDLPVAFRRTDTPDACLEALERILAAKADFLGDGPALEVLDGYGEAKTWGLAAAADLQAYRAGRLEWAEIDHRGLLLSGPPEPWRKARAFRWWRPPSPSGTPRTTCPGPCRPSARCSPKPSRRPPASCSSTNWMAYPTVLRSGAITSSTGRRS